MIKKTNLIRRCINVVNNTGVSIVTLIFDGCTVNIRMARTLGCKLYTRPENLITYFNANNNNVNIILDPSHIIKFVRNAFGEKRQFIELNDEIVDFKCIEKLLIHQENEHAHLENKIKKPCFLFQKKNEGKIRYLTFISVSC